MIPKRIIFRPHPFIFNRSSLVLPFVITCLVVLVFRPFEFSQYTFPVVLLWSLAFGFIASACVWGMVKVFQMTFSDAYLEDHWTVGKEILLIFSVLLCIMLAVFVILMGLNPDADRWKLLGLVLVRTFLISLFPVLILVLFEQYHYQKLKRKEALQLNLSLQKSGVASVGVGQAIVEEK